MASSMIKGYPEGSDITIIDAIYHSPSKVEITANNGSVSSKWAPASMDVIFRDNKTGIKHRQIFKEPKIEFYMANDDVYIPKNPDGEDEFPPYLPIEKVHPVRCKYTELKKTIAELTGRTQEYYDNIRNGLSKNNEMLHVNNRLYRSDINIEDYYRYEFNKRYTNSVDIPLKKAYIDIETDGINMLGDFPTAQDSPVNAVTLINMDNKQIYTFLLRDKDNPQCKEFEESLKNPETFEKIRSDIIDHIGDWKKATRLGVIDILNFNFYFYDEEIELISDLFKLIHFLNPDFLLAWNMAFDIPFLIDRTVYLGYDPRSIMTHPDFMDDPDLYYFVDERHSNEPAEAGDYAHIPGYTVYLDQLITFVSRRKGQAIKAKSNRLDDVAEAIAKVRKYDYHHICNSIVELCRANYYIFVLYNILDVICQVCIENKTGDIDFVFNKAISTNTRYSKVHRQTIYLYNRAVMSYERNGFIIGNNVNKFKPRPKGKFKGAFVADYRLNDDSLKQTINGYPIDVYNNADDFDEMLVA